MGTDLRTSRLRLRTLGLSHVGMITFSFLRSVSSWSSVVSCVRTSVINVNIWERMWTVWDRFVLDGQLVGDWLVHLRCIPRGFQWVRRGVSAPAVLDDATKPPLYSGQVVHVVHVGLGQGNVAHEVFEAGLLFIERFHLSAVVVHVAFIRRHLLQGWRSSWWRHGPLPQSLRAPDESVSVCWNGWCPPAP